MSACGLVVIHFEIKDVTNSSWNHRLYDMCTVKCT